MPDITIPGMFLTGDHASRPAASAVGGGSIYSCTTHSLIYQSDGSSWTTWATLGGSSDLDAIITASSGQDIADALAGASAPDAGNVFATMADVGGGGGGGVDPWLIEISPQAGAHGNTNWDTNAGNASYFGAFDNESSGAQNDEIYWDIGFSGGTWDLELVASTANNRGIYTASIDGSSIGTIDGYSVGSVTMVRSVLTGITIASGKRRLKLKMATKNASSSNYFGTIQHIQLRRTA